MLILCKNSHSIYLVPVPVPDALASCQAHLSPYTNTPQF